MEAEDRISRHREAVVTIVQGWWDKYRITLNDLEAERELAAAKAKEFLGNSVMNETESRETVVLGTLFSQTSATLTPKMFGSETFLHYSLPAFDEVGGPTVELGVEIESNKTVLPSDLILVSKLNPRKPRVQLVRKDTEFRQIASTEFIALVPRDESLDLRYFRHLLNRRRFRVDLSRLQPAPPTVTCELVLLIS